MICWDGRNPKAVSYKDELLRRLPGELDDVVIVIGGDGFLLQTVASQGFDRTYLGLNAGHLGFLHNDVDRWDEVVQRLRDRAWTPHTFPLLEARIRLESGEVVTEKALNDVYLERMTGQTARLKLVIDGHCVVEQLVADGIIFSTALGSTAYSFSSGASPCHPTLRVMAVAPICPHLPRLSPFVLPETAQATVEVEQPDRRPVRAVADGREHNHVRRVDIALGPQQVKLAYFEGHDFTSRMIRKLLHP